MELHCIAQRNCKLLSLLRTELHLSSSLVKRLKTQNAFQVNGVPAHTDAAVHPDDVISVLLDEAPSDFPPENGPIDILYEDEALLVLDKPPGIVIHPTAGRNTGTLANRLAGYFLQTGQRCGIHPVTRLDRDTFGVCLIAKNAHIHALLCQSQRNTCIAKTYLATVLAGPIPLSGSISRPIARRPGGSLLREIRADGQPAQTEYRVIGRSGPLCLLELHPITGRTHQLRVHCAAMGWPILGDRQYGTDVSISLSEQLELRTQQLCACKLQFPHPLNGRVLEVISRQTPYWPEDFPI